ncbi:MAG: translation initiation factor eIF-2B [Candidatus Aenigmarchaeota archaeon]|nr:translation initiation factor eIF-2B [Candidatus Aenigmarchaeota archaeon]
MAKKKVKKGSRKKVFKTVKPVQSKTDKTKDTEWKLVKRKVNDTVRRIRNLEIQGAREISVASMSVLKEVAQVKGFGPEFALAAEKFIGARPTGISLYNCMKPIKEKKSIKSIDKVLKYLVKAQEWLSYNGSKLIKNNVVIMTHCHSSSVLNVLKKAKGDHRDFRVIVSETRPKLQGMKTAKELIGMGIPIYYIVDSAGPFLVSKCDMVIVGADAIRADGVLNKIGTYPIALAAMEASIPFYVAASKDKLDYDCVSEIEDRPDREIGNPDELEASGGEIENPAFDLTPWKLITGVITESGVLGQREIRMLLDGNFKI